MKRRGEDLGSCDGLSAEALAGECALWLSDRGFLLQTRILEGSVIVTAVKAGWGTSLTGRRKALEIRILKRGARWRGEAQVKDLSSNMIFAAAAALLGPVGWAGATVSAVSRIWDPDWIRDLFAFLRARIRDAMGQGPRLP